MRAVGNASLRLSAFALALAVGCASCAETGNNPEDPTASVRRDFGTFRTDVYPVLLRDCGFPACHGDSARFFHVWGPGRVRIAGDLGLPEAFDLPTGNEIGTTLELARAMIDPDDPERSPLLRKPLAVAAGGAGHLGVDKYGRDVYRTTEDEGYVVLRAWVTSPDPRAMTTGATP